MISRGFEVRSQFSTRTSRVRVNVYCCRCYPHFFFPAVLSWISNPPPNLSKGLETPCAIINNSRRWYERPIGPSKTWHRKPRLTVAKKVIARLKANLKKIFRQGRGKNIQTTIKEMTPKLRGWIIYFRYSEVKGIFEELDGWLRRKLRRILWKRWKRPATRAKNLMSRGLSEATAGGWPQTAEAPGGMQGPRT